MATLRKLSLAFSLMDLNISLLDVGILNFVRKYVVHVTTGYIYYVWAIENHSRTMQSGLHIYL